MPGLCLHLSPYRRSDDEPDRVPDDEPDHFPDDFPDLEPDHVPDDEPDHVPDDSDDSADLCADAMCKLGWFRRHVQLQLQLRHG